MSRAGKLAEDFHSRFRSRPEIYRAPGRVNIIGGHCDYNDGFVLPTTTALYTWIAIAPRPDRTIRCYSANYDEERSFNLDDIRRSSDHHWSDYIKGVALVLLEDGKITGGSNILIDGDLPLGGGLSSSASLETGLALALLGNARQDVDRRELALLCQRAEVEFVGARCGVMDQYAISCGVNGHATMLDCRILEHRDIPLPDDLRVLVVDTGVKHRLAAGGLNTRREECEAAVAALAVKLPRIRALRDISVGELEENKMLLDETLYKRSRHVVNELLRVQQAAEALLSGDLAAIGKLVSSSHASLRDDFEVSCPEMDALICILMACDGVYGARLVGAGFGGCAISIVAPESLDSVMNVVTRDYCEVMGEDPWMHQISPSGPAEYVDTIVSGQKETTA